MKALKVFLVLILLNTTGYSYTSHPDSVVVFDDLRLALKKVYQKPDTSLLLVNRAIKICKHNNYPFGLMKSLNLKGICYDILGKNDSALTQYYIAKKLALKLNDPNSIAQITTNIGLIYWNQNRLDSAIFCYTNSYGYFKKVNNLKGLGNALNNLGLIYFEKKELKKARTAYREALSIKQKLNDNFGIGAAYANLGETFMDINDSANYYLKKAMPFQIKANDLSGLSKNYNNLASGFVDSNQPDSVIFYYQKAIELKKQIGDQYGLTSSLYNFAFFYVKYLKQYQKAFPMLVEAREISLKNQYARLTHKIYQFLAKINYQKKNYQLAYLQSDSAYKQYYEAFNKESDEKLRELEVQFEVEQQNHKIDKLSAEKQISELQIQQKNNQLIMLIVIIIMLIIISLYVYQVQKNKKQKELSRAILLEREQGLKAIIQATENERQRIAKDLHDGIGQQMAAIKLKFSKLQDAISQGISPSSTDAESIMNIITAAGTDVRTISHEMMPRSLQENGLIPAIEQMLDNTLTPAAIEFRFEHFNVKSRFTESIEITIYRILQELVKNIINHSKANFVSVQLMVIKSQIVLIVEDNGVGISDQKSDGIGLLSLKSRVNNIHGNINFEPSPQSGTLVTARIPLN